MLRALCLLLFLPSFVLSMLPQRAAAADGAWPGGEVKTAAARGCARFAEAGVAGTFVLFDPQARQLSSCDPARAAQRFLPGSTFKVPNALNALEHGIVADERQVFTWDGVQRAVPAWNRDTDLATGLKQSTIWFYQVVARRTGAERMQAFVDRLDYGNRDIGGGIDRFWLDGDLRISAYEQVAFLDRLRRDALPLSARSQEIVRRIMEVDRGPDWVLRAKSGITVPLSRLHPGVVDSGRADDTGWYVGWSERDGRAFVFALNLHLRDMRDLRLREALARALLADNGALPALPAEASGAR